MGFRQLVVFNLGVDEAHSYRVSQLAVLVHNKCKKGVRLPVEERKAPFHYDKSSKNRRKAYEKAKKAGDGRQPDFDSGHNGGPGHYHPIGPDGDRIPGSHITWKGAWSGKR